MIDIEEFKEIPGTNGYYSCDRYGNIRSNERVIYRDNWQPMTIHSRILKWKYNNQGYAFVSLRVDKKTIYRLVHRLIAQTWIPNPNNYPAINHKDNNPLNNCVDNLEWCTISYNNDYSRKQGRMFDFKDYNIVKAVDQFDLDGNFIKSFPSMAVASVAMCGNTNRRTNIWAVCNGKSRTAFGYKWKYSKQQSTSND